MIREIFAIISIAYSAFVYVSLLNDGIMNIWIQFAGTSLTTFFKAVVIYSELQEKYPTIIYSDKDYDIPLKLKIIKIILWIFFFVVLAFLAYLSFLFVLNSENPVGALILEVAGMISIFLITHAFILNGHSSYSGNAYCDGRMMHTNNTIKYCFIPASLTAEQLEIYKREAKLA